MKQFFLLLCTLLFSAAIFAQVVTTGRIENLKDDWGTSYTYVGEIKNKMPNGLGMAIYSNGHALKYAGYFLNGKFHGKGALVFEDGSFLSGDWKNGKLDGNCASLNKDWDLFIGAYKNGKKDGRGTYFYKDKSFLVGQLKDDNYNGRCIFINASGTTLADNLYVNSKKDGTGYQYEVEKKKLYEGTWRGGEWVSSGTASFKSFVTNTSFTGESTADQIIMGCTDKDRYLEDTAFWYDIKKSVRYFGKHKAGYLVDGLIIRDSSRFLGKVNDRGVYGYCSFLKLGKYYDEGMYKNDFLEGANNLSINLDKKAIYYGSTKEGNFTGKAWLATASNDMYVGSFEGGQFTGTGYMLFRNGKCVKGTFKDGSTETVTAFIDENGKPISLKPKTTAEALNIVVGEYDNNYEALKGSTILNMNEYDTAYYRAEKSIISFPGSVRQNLVFETWNFYIGYEAAVYKGSNFAAAKTQYDKLCKEIAATSIKSKNGTVKPTGTKVNAKEGNTVNTRFEIAQMTDYNIWVQIKYEDGNYIVRLIAGDYKLED